MLEDGPAEGVQGAHAERREPRCWPPGPARSRGRCGCRRTSPARGRPRARSPRPNRRRPRPPARSRPSRAVEWRGLSCAVSPSSSSCRTSPPRIAQTAVSAVAVSKPTTAFSWALSSASDPEDEGADPFAFDEPGHAVLAGNVRGDLVDVERSLRRRLGFRADVFAGRELDADAVVDVAFEALEECALFGSLRALVRRFRVLGDAAGNVVLVRGRTRRRSRRRLPAVRSPAAPRSASSIPSSGVPPVRVSASFDATGTHPSNTLFAGGCGGQLDLAPVAAGVARAGPRACDGRPGRLGECGPLDEGDAVGRPGSRRAGPDPRPRGPRGGRGRGGRPAVAHPRSAGRW